MGEIFETDRAPELLAALAGPAPFLDLAVANLDYMARLTRSDYRKMFELADHNEIATYNLAYFLIVLGGVGATALTSLCGEAVADEVFRSPQLNEMLNAGDNSSDAKRLEFFHKAPRVTKEEVAAFRAKLAYSIATN